MRFLIFVMLVSSYLIGWYVGRENLVAMCVKQNESMPYKDVEPFCRDLLKFRNK